MQVQEIKKLAGRNLMTSGELDVEQRYTRRQPRMRYTCILRVELFDHALLKKIV